MESQLVRKAFLRAFVRFAIEHSYKPSKKLKEEIKQQIEEEQKREVTFENMTKAEPKSVLGRKMPPAANLPKLPQRIYPLANPVVRNIPITNISLKPTKINLGKIAQILSDPSVFSVECLGAQKNLLVNRSGLIQTAPFVLSKEEIYSILNEISDKTRIPLTKGLFTAALQDLHVTAVISELAGTRFLIQKINPFMRRF